MAHRILCMGAAPPTHREVTLSVEPPELEHARGVVRRDAVLVARA